MNKQELLNKCKDNFFYYTIEINKKIPSVYFETWTKDARSNCYVEIPINNNKKEIYETINKLLNNFDFSFKTSFESVKEINEFLGGC